MKCRGWMIGAAVVLTGCGNGAAEPAAPTAARAPNPAANAEVSGPERRILAFGDSLFAGYRLGRTQSYPARLQAALRAAGINARVANAGISGDTTAAGLQRFPFVLRGQGGRPDLVIVELGGNDLLRGIPPAEVRANLAMILDTLRAERIPVVLMGMRAPPNVGPEFRAGFDGLYPALAAEYGATLVPFFMAPIYDRPALLQQDHIHPTAEGVDALVAATVEQVADALPD